MKNNPYYVLVDSGASTDLTPHHHLLHDTYQDTPNTYITANKSLMAGSGTFGTIRTKNFEFPGVEHVPSACSSLLSVGNLADRNYDVWFKASDKTVHIGHLPDNLPSKVSGNSTKGNYYLPIYSLNKEQAYFSNRVNTP